MIQPLRVPLGFAIAVAALYFATPSGTSIAAGVPIALAGAGFRFLAAGTIRKDAQLATAGPYAWTRNPLYLGSFLLTLGFAVMSASIVSAALLLVPSAVIYPAVIRKEEAHLQRLFPTEFPAYRESVPVFFPRFRATEMDFSFKQYWANTEYNSILGFLGALAIMIVKWRW